MRSFERWKNTLKAVDLSHSAEEFSDQRRLSLPPWAIPLTLSQKLLYRQAIPLNSLLNYSLLQVSIALGIRTRPLLWSNRQILNGVLYQLKNGCNWGDLPRDLLPYSTVY